MLSVFPDLLYLSLISPTIIRIFLGLIFIYFGIKAFKSDKNRVVSLFGNLHFKNANLVALLYGMAQIAIGFLLFIGLFAQVAAILAAVISLKWIYLKKKGENLGNESYAFYLLVFAISISLLFTGPGILAFDIPL